jgi:hypothetical protein
MPTHMSVLTDSEDKDTLRRQWRVLFIIAAVVVLLGALLYSALASGSKQPWADKDATPLKLSVAGPSPSGSGWHATAGAASDGQPSGSESHSRLSLSTAAGNLNGPSHLYLTDSEAQQVQPDLRFASSGLRDHQLDTSTGRAQVVVEPAAEAASGGESRDHLLPVPRPTTTSVLLLTECQGTCGSGCDGQSNSASVTGSDIILVTVDVTDSVEAGATTTLCLCATQAGRPETEGDSEDPGPLAVAGPGGAYGCTGSAYGPASTPTMPSRSGLATV